MVLSLIWNCSIVVFYLILFSLPGANFFSPGFPGSTLALCKPSPLGILSRISASKTGLRRSEIVPPKLWITPDIEMNDQCHKKFSDLTLPEIL